MSLKLGNILTEGLAIIGLLAIGKHLLGNQGYPGFEIVMGMGVSFVVGQVTAALIWFWWNKKRARLKQPVASHTYKEKCRHRFGNQGPNYTGGRDY